MVHLDDIQPINIAQVQSYKLVKTTVYQFVACYLSDLIVIAYASSG
jgi:hypothetical protein